MPLSKLHCKHFVNLGLQRVLSLFVFGFKCYQHLFLLFGFTGGVLLRGNYRSIILNQQVIVSLSRSDVALFIALWTVNGYWGRMLLHMFINLLTQGDLACAITQLQVGNRLIDIVCLHALLHLLQELQRRVSVVPQLEVIGLLINVAQSELVLVAVATLDAVVWVTLGPLRLPADAQAADVVPAAVGDQNVVEVAQTNRAVEFIGLAELLGLWRVIPRVLVDRLDVIFLELGRDAN